MNFPGLRILGTALAAVVLAAGCARRAEVAEAKPAGPKLRKVSLQTDWFPQAEHGGFYQALAKGFYREAGLDVTLLPGGPGAGIALKVAKGDADFGMNRSDNILRSATQGLPLVMVMATMQHDAQALMLREENPVKSLRDLEGKTIMANVGMAWIPYVQKKYGIAFNLTPNSYGIGGFLADPNVIQQCFLTNEPFLAQQRGIRVRTLALAESGYDCYQVIFCRRELIRDAPEAVRAFVGASIRGWRDYLEGDPAPADKLILQRNPQMTPELLKFSRSEMILRSLVEGDRTKDEDIGQLSLGRLAAELEVLLDLKVLDTPVAISSVATREFLPPELR